MPAMATTHTTKGALAMQQETDPRLAQWREQAYQLGVEHAQNTAAWITDGNDSDENRRAKLQRIEDDGVDSIIVAPNLSGEWADNPTPRSLFEGITAYDAHAEATFNVDAYDVVVDALAEAYEAGVSDTFEDACIAELTRWLS